MQNILLINIKEPSKFNFMIELLNSFEFIEIIKPPEKIQEANNNLFSDEMKAILDERLESLKDENTKFYTWEEIKNEMYKLNKK